jgi:cell wall assembly regulator SMI1
MNASERTDRVSAVSTLWTRIVNLVEDGDPDLFDAINPPASDRAIARVASVVGRTLPADLVEFWSLADGVDHNAALQTSSGTRRPGKLPYSTAQALEEREMLLQVAGLVSELSDEDLVRYLAVQDAEPAGTWELRYWLPSWIPLASNDGGDYLLVDLRRGERFGCIMSYSTDVGSSAQPLWPSVTAMLTSAAEFFE